MIRYGPMSIVLLLGAVQGAIVAISLFARAKHPADRFLGALLALLSLKLVPYIIGYAGFYMAYPWLDLAPFDLALGIGPLLYLFVLALTRPELLNRWWLHLVPVAFQLIIYLGLFIQPMSFKSQFESTTGPLFNRIENGLVVASLVFYLSLTWQVYRRYRADLTVSKTESRALRSLQVLLACVSLSFGSFVFAKGWGWVVHPLSYFQMFPFYLGLTALLYGIGLAAFPLLNLPFPAPASGMSLKPVDWHEIAEGFSQQLIQTRLWQDPLLSLPTAARALGTTEVKLSRALNSGLGVGFNEWVNRHRVSQVLLKLENPREDGTILEVAFDCGFNSKASFHRWFRSTVGCTPSEFKRRAGQVEGPG